MNEANDEPSEAVAPPHVGERLRLAREAKGLTLEDIAQRTRVPIRMLAALEASDHATLPAPTYSAGFVKNYARQLDLDGTALSRDFRQEMEGVERERYVLEPLEPVDAARVPSRLLAGIALATIVLLAAAYAIWRGGLFGGDDADERARLAAGTMNETAFEAPVAAPAPSDPSPAPTAPALPAADGPVVIAALEPVWIRIYDADGSHLFEGMMTVGQRFDIPATARDPMLLTGRPQALRITVGGAEVPAVGAPERTVRDVRLSSAALRERIAGAGTPGATGTVSAPLPGAPSTPTGGPTP